MLKRMSDMNNEPMVIMDTAAMLMGLSKRTLWRYLREGKLSSLPKDSKGRGMLLIREIAGRSLVRLNPGNGDPELDDYALLAQADQGDGAAQTGLALLLLQQEQYALALHWLEQAAEQGYADAMHHLAGLYQAGAGVERCPNTALAWRSKAAALGHPIAREQLASL